jgi:hypothetical protein
MEGFKEFFEKLNLDKGVCVYILFKVNSFWGCSSVVEHLPFKQVVDGSIPSTLKRIFSLQKL